MATADGMIFIAASWKQRERVRQLAVRIREVGYPVYDFTDSACRDTPELPPERFPELFDPEKHGSYWEYLNSNPYYRPTMEGNRRALDHCAMVVLLLPCGMDATADWAYAVGKGKQTYLVGNPNRGERTPVHLWANGWFPDEEAFLRHLTIN